MSQFWFALREIALLLFDTTTVVVVAVASLLYCVGYCVADRWTIFHLFAACISEDRLTAIVRRIMDFETSSRFTHRPRTGMKLLWRTAWKLNVELGLKAIGAAQNEDEKLSAIYMVGQTEESEPMFSRFADEDSSDPSARAAAAVVKEKAMSASAAR